MDIKEIENEIMKGEVLEDIIKKFKWRSFETLCARIFGENGFSVRQNCRFREGEWLEIDIVAEKGGMAIAADCKKWGRVNGKNALRKAALRQRGRAEAFKNHFGVKGRVYPLIITWLEQEVAAIEDVWIVPAAKLNRFLLDLDSYLPEMSRTLKFGVNFPNLQLPES